MDMRRRTGGSTMLSRLFFRLLPVQILLVAMGSLNSIVDGMIAGRFISAETIGVVGLFNIQCCAAGTWAAAKCRKPGACFP